MLRDNPRWVLDNLENRKNARDIPILRTIWKVGHSIIIHPY